jgi:predicted aldo/keto reductase-like oxidoreductase
MKNALLSLNPKRLGFGLMRLPTDARGDIDYRQTGDMIDLFMKRGFSYFDTAYVYHGGGSERAAKELLSNRYPRESFTLATKLPLWNIKNPGDMQRILEEQLRRAGVDYFDFYLLHSLNEANAQAADLHGAWAWAAGLKERGLARHVGFSFHDRAETLDRLLTAHPEMEFVQLQINYADWESASVQSRLCHETALRHGTPVVVMEPVKGGSLTVLDESALRILRRANPAATPASWALRYVMALDGVFSILSGMSSLEQLKENLDLFGNARPLSADERAALAEALAEINRADAIPCTGCNYCYEACPLKINAPFMIGLVNNYNRFKYLEQPRRSYHIQTAQAPKASSCLECGSCEAHCPQGIAVMEALKDARRLFEDNAE